MSISNMVVIVGVPLDVNSSFLRGAAAAPDRIREALHSPSSNLCAENGIDLGADSRWRDAGDVGTRRGAAFVLPRSRPSSPLS